jgi:hypothetical protein
MTDIFNFILVMISLVLAIGVTHLVQRVAELIRLRAAVPLDFLQLTWAASLFVVAAIYWWSLWDLRQADWSFPTFFFLLLSPALLHIAVSLLVAPEVDAAGRTATFDFARIRMPFMLVMLTFTVLVSVDGWVVGVEPAWTAYRPVQFLSAGLYLAGAILPAMTAQRSIATLELLTYVVVGFVFRFVPGAFGS